MMEESRNLLNILSSAMGDYISLRTDDLKKSIIAGLAAGFSRALSILVITMLLLIVLGVFAYAFILLIGEAIGNMSGAAFIVGGVYLIGAVILFLLRKRLFLTMFCNLFTEITAAESPVGNWKSLLLLVVRNLRNSLNG